MKTLCKHQKKINELIKTYIDEGFRGGAFLCGSSLMDHGHINGDSGYFWDLKMDCYLHCDDKVDIVTHDILESKIADKRKQFIYTTINRVLWFSVILGVIYFIHN